MNIKEMRENALRCDRQYTSVRNSLRELLTLPRVLSANSSGWSHNIEKDLFYKDVTEEFRLLYRGSDVRLQEWDEISYENGILKVYYKYYSSVGDYEVKLEIKNVPNLYSEFKYKTLLNGLLVRYNNLKQEYLDKLCKFGITELKTPSNLQYCTLTSTSEGAYTSKQFYAWTRGGDGIEVEKGLKDLFCYNGYELLDPDEKNKFILGFKFRPVEGKDYQESIVVHNDIRIVVKRVFTDNRDFASYITVNFETTSGIKDIELALAHNSCEARLASDINGKVRGALNELGFNHLQWEMNESKDAATTYIYAGEHYKKIAQRVSEALPTDIFEVEGIKMQLDIFSNEKSGMLKVTMKMK